MVCYQGDIACVEFSIGVWADLSMVSIIQCGMGSVLVVFVHPNMHSLSHILDQDEQMLAG